MLLCRHGSVAYGLEHSCVGIGLPVSLHLVLQPSLLKAKCNEKGRLMPTHEFFKSATGSL